MWIIWKLRNRRTVGEEETPKDMYKSLFTKEIRSRIMMDYSEHRVAIPKKKASRTKRASRTLIENFRKKWLETEYVGTLLDQHYRESNWTKTL